MESLQSEAETTRTENVTQEEAERQPKAEKPGGKSEDGFFMTQVMLGGCWVNSTGGGNHHWSVVEN